MFRARFNAAFPKSLSQFGPQELEQDIVDSPPGDRVENFLCALLSLVLNRKQDVKYATPPPRFEHHRANPIHRKLTALDFFLDLATTVALWKTRSSRTNQSGLPPGKSRAP